MKILSVEIYRDGGSMDVKTDKGNFHIHTQIHIRDEQGGKVFTDWPDKGGTEVDAETASEVKSLANAFYDGMIHQQHLMVHK